MSGMAMFFAYKITFLLDYSRKRRDKRRSRIRSLLHKLLILSINSVSSSTILIGVNYS